MLTVCCLKTPLEVTGEIFSHSFFQKTAKAATAAEIRSTYRKSPGHQGGHPSLIMQGASAGAAMSAAPPRTWSRVFKPIKDSPFTVAPYSRRH